MKASFEKTDIKMVVKKMYGFRTFLPMFHSHIEIVYVLSGKLSVTIDGRHRVLTAGEMSMVFPYVVHSYEKSDDAEVAIMMFSPEIIAHFKKEFVSGKPENPYIEKADSFLPLINKLLSYSGTDEKMSLAYLNVIAGEIVNSVKLIKTENVDMTSAQQILVYCSENYRENLNVKKVAAALYLSESYVSKIFSMKLGYSFREYINTLRISEAKKLLKTTDEKITDVMYSVGFENQSSFNRIFLDETGMTPIAYKKISGKYGGRADRRIW